jgi:Kip1 ubiquitination-promoting complex protein 1
MTNLILVRFWKGHGFGFRYSQTYPSKFLQSLRKDRIQGNKQRTNTCQSCTIVGLDPSPSIRYQQEIGQYLLSNVDEAIVFLNSLLGQMNWAFSEFMGLLKEVIEQTSCFY